MIPDLLADLFSDSDMFGVNLMMKDVYALMTELLSWDVVLGGMAFIMALGIALYAINRIRQAFGV